jgi:hypothetical protein
LLYFVQFGLYRDRELSGVFVPRFRAPLQSRGTPVILTVATFISVIFALRIYSNQWVKTCFNDTYSGNSIQPYAFLSLLFLKSKLFIFIFSSVARFLSLHFEKQVLYLHFQVQYYFVLIVLP